MTIPILKTPSFYLQYSKSYKTLNANFYKYSEKQLEIAAVCNELSITFPRLKSHKVVIEGFSEIISLNY